MADASPEIPADCKLVFGLPAVHVPRIERDEEGVQTGVTLYHPAPELGQQTLHMSLTGVVAQRIRDDVKDMHAILSDTTVEGALREVARMVAQWAPIAPEWCHSPDDPAVGHAVAQAFGLEHSDALPEWEHYKGAVTETGLPPVAGGAGYQTEYAPDLGVAWQQSHEFALGTKDGIDFLFEAMMAGKINSSTGEPAVYVALTENNTAPVNTNKALAGEFKVGTPTGEEAGGALLRQKASYTHTTGTAIALLEYTFTFNAKDRACTVNQFGVFGGASAATIESGTLVMQTKISPTSFAAVGDKAVLKEEVEVVSFT